uniref:Uncharacterized protein n=1 Tax=Magallana gigas TaxID=29159 RepID=K1QJ93_MAGGI
MTTLKLYLWFLIFIWKVPQKGETVSCNFESGDACGWKNENFTVSKFKSDLEQSGPEKAFEGDSYAFFYEEKNEESGAILEFTVQESNGNCLFLAYHMWGSHMGSLEIEVYKTTANSWETVKKFNGNLGNMWHCNGIELPSIANTDTKLKVRIHALRGQGIYSIIGIDDIRVFEAGSTCSSATDYRKSGSDSYFTNVLGITEGHHNRDNSDVRFFQRNKKDKKDKAHHDDFFHGQSPLGFRADRYRSFPHNHHLHEEEVYDEIKDENRTSKVSNLNYRNGPQNNGNIGSYSKDEYLTPSFAGENGQDSYLTPVSLHDKDSSDYTVLPAVTLPIDQITAKYNPGGRDTMNQENGEYVEPKDLNMPKTRGKKISISDQGEPTTGQLTMSIPRLHQTGVRRVLHAQSLVLDKGSRRRIGRHPASGRMTVESQSGRHHLILGDKRHKHWFSGISASI